MIPSSTSHFYANFYYYPLFRLCFYNKVSDGYNNNPQSAFLLLAFVKNRCRALDQSSIARIHYSLMKKNAAANIKYSTELILMMIVLRNSSGAISKYKGTSTFLIIKNLMSKIVDERSTISFYPFKGQLI